jgi:hypothetical protein
MVSSRDNFPCPGPPRRSRRVTCLRSNQFFHPIFHQAGLFRTRPYVKAGVAGYGAIGDRRNVLLHREFFTAHY